MKSKPILALVRPYGSNASCGMPSAVGDLGNRAQPHSAGNLQIARHDVFLPFYAASALARRRTPISSSAASIAATARAMSSGVMAPMQPTRKLGSGVL